jgi:hypothetical protein
MPFSLALLKDGKKKLGSPNFFCKLKTGLQKNPVWGGLICWTSPKTPVWGGLIRWTPPKTPVWGGVQWSHLLSPGQTGTGDRGPGPYPVASPVQETCRPAVFSFPLFPFLFQDGTKWVCTSRDVPGTKTSGRNGKMWNGENSGSTRFLQSDVLMGCLYLLNHTLTNHTRKHLVY